MGKMTKVLVAALTLMTMLIVPQMVSVAQGTLEMTSSDAMGSVSAQLMPTDSPVIMDNDVVMIPGPVRPNEGLMSFDDIDINSVVKPTPAPTTAPTAVPTEQPSVAASKAQTSFTVTYQVPTADGIALAYDVSDLPMGCVTPPYEGSLYLDAESVFSGWFPAVANTVTEDAVYTAEFKPVSEVLDSAVMLKFDQKSISELKPNVGTPCKDYLVSLRGTMGDSRMTVIDRDSILLDTSVFSTLTVSDVRPVDGLTFLGILSESSTSVEFLSAKGNFTFMLSQGAGVSDGTRITAFDCQYTLIFGDSGQMYVPTMEPTPEPTVVPIETVALTVEPTVIPTEAPTTAPTVEPTVIPTEAPTTAPTVEPTVSPDPIVTEAPTATPPSEPESEWVTITLDHNDGTVVDHIRVEVGKEVPLPTPTRKSYSFDGWHTQRDGGSMVISMIATQDTTLYAHWHRSAVVITFDSRGGTDVSALEVQYGLKVKLPDGPTREGYEFLGWYDAKSGGSRFTELQAIESCALYAQWERVKQTFTVKYVDGVDGKAFTTVSYSVLEDDKTPMFDSNDPTYSGYVFKGWDPAVAKKVTQNVVYTAKWITEAQAAADAEAEATANDGKADATASGVRTGDINMVVLVVCGMAALAALLGVLYWQKKRTASSGEKPAEGATQAPVEPPESIDDAGEASEESTDEE